MKFVTVKDQDSEFIGLVDESENLVLPLKRTWQARFGNHDFPATLLAGIEMGKNLQIKYNN